MNKPLPEARRLALATGLCPDTVRKVLRRRPVSPATYERLYWALCREGGCPPLPPEAPHLPASAWRLAS